MIVVCVCCVKERAPPWTETAESVGSDESFFLADGTAWATGRGEGVVSDRV